MASLRAQISGESAGQPKENAPAAQESGKSEVRHMEEPRERPHVTLLAEPARSGMGIIIFASVLAAFWVGAALA